MQKDTASFVAQLLEWLRGQGRVLIIVHDNPDPDAMAAALALQYLLVMKLGREPTIAFSGFIGRSENLVMASILEVKLTPLELVNLGDYSVICLLDCQPLTGNTTLPLGQRVELVIDHHPLREGTAAIRWVDVREGYGATATILYEYLLSQDLSCSTRIATALFYAIKTETQDLGRDATVADRQAYNSLFPMVNKQLLYQMSHPRYPREYYQTIGKALVVAEVRGKLLVSRIGEVVIPELVSEVADFLIPLDEVEIVLCLGRYNGDGYVSLRCRTEQVAAGALLRLAIAGLGTGGGHDMLAGGRLERQLFSPRTLTAAESELVQRVADGLGLQKASKNRLLTIDTYEGLG